MANLTEQIRNQMLDATRARDTVRRNTLRLLISAIQNGRIEAGHDLDDDETIRVLQKEAKQRRESIEEYRKGNREDLVAQEQQELDIIEEYLPTALTEDELRAIVQETIAEVGASGPDDLGKVMRPLMQKLAGRADGREANAIVRESLAG